MTTLQRGIKYLAIALAVCIIVSIFSGILGIFDLFDGVFDDGGEVEVGEMKQYPVSENIRELDILISAADFSIRTADTFSVESNLKKLTVTERDGVLIVKDEARRASKVQNDAAFVLCLPENVTFDRVRIVTGAGRVSMEELSAKELSLTLGAGEVTIGSLTATKRAEIEGGAGKVTVSHGSLSNLDLEMGVGQLNFTAALLGECDLELGVGESNLTLLGSREDYTVDLDKGIGSITVDGKKVSDFGTFGNGVNEVSVDGGIGAIHLTFEEENVTEDAA